MRYSSTSLLQGEMALAQGVEQCDSEWVQVTAADVAGIPRSNIRVPCAEFVAVWRAAVHLDRSRAVDDDWYSAAVALTCRWLATAPTRTARGGGLTRSPAMRRQVLAYEELIEAECLAAEQLETLRPDLAARPGWCEAVRATLRWAWKRSGEPPVPVTTGAVSG